MNNEKTLQLIYQYLQDQGYSQALSTLQSESGVDYESGTFEKAHRLRHILNEHHDLTQSLLGPDPSSLDEMSFDQELKIQEHSATASAPHLVVDKAHNGGLISIRCAQYGDQTLLATSSTTREIKIWDATSSVGDSPSPPECLGTIMCNSTCLSVEFHPRVKGMILFGTMEGSVKIVKESHLTSRSEIMNETPHSKYVVRSKWGKRCFATASYDNTMNLYRLKEGTTEEEPEYEHVQKWSFSGNVEALEFTPDDIALVVATRGDNYLSYIQLRDLTISRINMNATGDDHVSFTAMYIECNPSGSHLLVQTDKDRIIVMRTHTPIQSKNLYGTVNNEFSQPRATWHPSGKYIYGTSQNNIIFSWDVITEEIVYRMRGHTGYPRDLCYHPSLEFLFTCSYDKSIRIWGINHEQE